MKLPKPSDDDKAVFRSLVPDAPGIEIKPMFGSLGAFVNGNMFMGLFGADIGVKLLDDVKLAELWEIEGTGHFGPAERPMGHFVSLPVEWRDNTERAQPWIAEALHEVSALQPKPPKSRT